MQRRKFYKLLFPLIVALAVVLMTASTALAVEAPDRLPPQAEVSDEELRAFTKATVEIEEIKVSYQLAVAEVAKELADHANTEIRGTLDEQKITVGEYDRILQAVERDPSLRRKAREIAREEVKKGGKQRALPPGEPAPPRSKPAPPPGEALPSPGELTSWQPR